MRLAVGCPPPLGLRVLGFRALGHGEARLRVVLRADFGMTYGKGAL